jgi:AraC family transcriptional regulator of adaptative response/methylated-DNA-[protein]-cysteine methyltransferase
MRAQTGVVALSDAERWEALVRRDPYAGSAFFYGVTTTGVYCRPGCSSRLPNRKNVVFFTNYFDAEKAGFRPCKRCLPNAVSADEERTAMMIRACKLIDESEEPPKLADLAAGVGISPSHLHRLFKEIVGVTPKAYAVALRMRRLQSALTQRVSITEAVYEAGFNSSSRFYERSADMLGMKPTSYKNGADGIRIRYAVTESFLGWVLVAATDRGICAIEFGDTPQTMVERLRDRFPKADLNEADSIFGGWVSKVTAFIEAPAGGLDLPLDIQGTAYQQRVWKALREIPAGSTRSYGVLARQIGNPKAARAVARACGANRIAVAIPCHRAIGSNGGLVGYRWGLVRKEALLDLEMSVK